VHVRNIFCCTYRVFICSTFAKYASGEKSLQFFILSWYQVACLREATNTKIDCGKYKLNYCSPTENLSFEIIVLCKGRVIFEQYIPKKHERFGIKITSCVIRRDIGLQRVSLCIQAKLGNVLLPRVTATDATVTGLSAQTENVGHKLYMGNPSPESCDNKLLWNS
jgi:hypothetical protein